ncbi:MAG TPA: OmpA family protein [Verrucomicrobiae bacterium]|jgi:peptidoglycan-associated lipoprotein
MMKRASLFSLLTLAAILSLAVTGCKSPQKPITDIPGGKRPPPVNPGPGGALAIKPGVEPGVGTVPIVVDPSVLANYNQDRETFKNDTVYFDFDRAAVKKSEQSKIETVAGHLKGNRSHMVQIEGHCDERGTEEYNRALGERRALAIREYLVRLGVDADRVHTITYGEDRPAVSGHNDAAWSKNRRGEFVLLTPKN